MSQMEYKFTHSLVVMGQLAKEASRTPPSEGKTPFEYIDRSLTILGRTSEVHSERMRLEFLSQREFIANQMKEVDKKLEDAKEEINGRFNKVDKKFEELEENMDRRFKEMDKKIDSVNDNTRSYLNHMQKASRNSLRIRGWEEIYPVGTLSPQGGIQTPLYFPRNVRHFWKLKDSTQINRLVYLIRFYQIQGYEEWGRDEDSFEGYSDSNESSQGTSESSKPISLEEAVRLNYDIAHRALGAQLGLPYDEIQNFMERAKALSQDRAAGKKRGQDDQTSEGRKKRGFNLSELTEVTSPTEPRSSRERTG